MVKPLVRSSSLVLALLVAPAARAAGAEPGVLWENTVSMKSAQFAMPPTTTQLCAPKEGLSEPPRGREDGNCKVTDVKKVGARMTWKMECTGENAMTAEGEIVQGKDRFDGKMTMHSAKMGDLEATMAGKRLGGACDAGKAKREVAALKTRQEAYQAQAADAQAQACDKAVGEMQVEMFTMSGAFCKEPAQVAKLCARVPTREGFVALSRHGKEQVDAAGKLCNLDVARTRAKLCDGAAADVAAGGSAPPADALAFLPASCPAESQALARKECTGRSYTGMPGAWRGFCVQVARQGLSQQEAGGEVKPASATGDDDQGESAKDKAIEKAKKGLKGLFGG
jgi:Protein of unknown function (DUF3617)